MEILNSFIEFFFHVVFWMMVIHFFRVVIFGRAEKVIDEETEKLKEKLSKMIHRIKQEKHGDTYYWFDSDDDQFLGQGKTDTEIIEHIKSRFPSHVFIVNNEKALRGPDWKLVPIQELTKKSV